MLRHAVHGQLWQGRPSSGPTGHLPPRGKACHNTKGASRPCCIFSTPLRFCFCCPALVRYWAKNPISPLPHCRCRCFPARWSCCISAGSRVSCALALWLCCWHWPPCGSSGLCNTAPPGWSVLGKKRPPRPGLRCFLAVLRLSGCCSVCSSRCLPSGMSSRRGAWPPRWSWSAAHSTWPTRST